MSVNKKTIDQYTELQAEKAELETELRRIDAFLNRDHNNKDNARAIDKGKIFVKFAGTACKLPVSLFTKALNDRSAELEQRLLATEDELNAL